ncbi:MAG: HlyD family secretion protein, partial [Pseudomonadota bacterium]|nr:HlyD family secretion protein [Pseudomonadota bacterium]
MSDEDQDKEKEEPSETEEETSSAKRTSRRKFGVRYLIIGLVVIVGGIFAFREVHQRLIYVYEYDARIAGDMVTVSSRVSGWVTALPVTEGQIINADQVLVKIDDRESKLLVKQLEAQRDAIKAQRNRLVTQRSLVDVQTKSRVDTQLAVVNAAAATVDALKPQLENARSNFKREESLFKKKVISRRQFDQTRTTMQQVDGEYRTSVAELEEARNRLREARADQQKLAVLDSEIEILVHEENELNAQIERQRLDRADRTIGSPVTGVVDRVFVEEGEYVTPGQRLLLVHDPKKVWIDANVKETDIRKVKIGQIVDVTVDAFPDKKFAGKVIAIGNAATSEFALLPTPNPSGNFTKITQRLRVRVAIDQEQNLLRPGMMVEVF